jgi:hypothetical protein
MLLATVVIDPPSVIALGAIFTLFAARTIAAGAPLKRSVLVGAFVGGWMGLCFGNHAFKYPAWMLVYLVDPKNLPTAVWYPIFLAVMIASGALGAYLAHGFIAQGKRGRALWLAAGMLLLWLALFGLTFQRYLVIGTFDEYRSGKALGLAAQPAVIHDFNVISVLTAVPLVTLLGLIIWRNRRAGRVAAAL